MTIPTKFLWKPDRSGHKCTWFPSSLPDEFLHNSSGKLLKTRKPENQLPALGLQNCSTNRLSNKTGAQKDQCSNLCCTAAVFPALWGICKSSWKKCYGFFKRNFWTFYTSSFHSSALKLFCVHVYITLSFPGNCDSGSESTRILDNS